MHMVTALDTWVFTFSVKLEKWSFHVAGLPRTGKKFTEIKKAREGRAELLFLFIKYAKKLWRCRCRRVVDLNSLFAFLLHVIAWFRVKFGRTVVDYRLQIGFKMQTKYKMQTPEWVLIADWSLNYRIVWYAKYFQCMTFGSLLDSRLRVYCKKIGCRGLHVANSVVRK